MCLGIYKKLWKRVKIWHLRPTISHFFHFCSFWTLYFFREWIFLIFNMFLVIFRSDDWENQPKKNGLVSPYNLRKNKHHSRDLSSMCLFHLTSFSQSTFLCWLFKITLKKQYSQILQWLNQSSNVSTWPLHKLPNQLYQLKMVNFIRLIIYPVLISLGARLNLWGEAERDWASAREF